VHVDGVLAGLLVAAFLAGGIDAIVGGGGLIQLPALFSALPGTPPATLLGTSKLAGFAGTASATWRYAHAVRIPWRRLAPVAVIAFAAALAGAVTVTHVAAATFRPLVPVLLTIVLLYTLTQRELGATHAPRDLDRVGAMTGAGLVAAIAFYDGFFGPGTGSFLMLLFIRHYGFDFLNAAAAARVLNAATNVAALAWFGSRGHMLWPTGLAMAAANIGGAQLGTRLALTRGTRFVRIVFIAVVATLIVRTAWVAFTGPR
jgi:uncharacterized membrane protein YfcA